MTYKTKEQQSHMTRIMQALLLSGAVLWCGTILLRIINVPHALRQILGVLPNWGAMWVVLGAVVIFWPLVTKHPFKPTWLMPLTSIVLGMAVLSECIHFKFLGAGLDWWDVATSLLAGGVIAVLYGIFHTKWSNEYHEKRIV